MKLAQQDRKKKKEKAIPKVYYYSKGLKVKISKEDTWARSGPLDS